MYWYWKAHVCRCSLFDCCLSLLQLASENWGVIGLKFREVDCNQGLGVHWH
jgi:hypothetical protein